nr:unnamed protein product [Naegleria fowleri]
MTPLMILDHAPSPTQPSSLNGNMKKKLFSMISVLMMILLLTSGCYFYSDTNLFVKAAGKQDSTFRAEMMMTTPSLMNTYSTKSNNSDLATLCDKYLNATNNGTKHTESEEEGPLTWYEYIIYACASLFFVGGAGLMSGFTLGLLSIDPMQLDILRNTGTESEKKYASRLAPILKHHHLLLVTLLLWNALCFECLPLFLHKIVPEYVAIILGVTFVLFFGEVIPQAVISRYGLSIGGTLFWLVWLLIVIVFVIAWPISKVLDWMLGSGHGTLYQRTELKELVNIHSQTSDQRYHLTEHEAKILGGALDFSKTSVRQTMTPIEKTYMLDIDSKLDVDTMTKIWQEGHSRIPIFKGNTNNIVGMLYVKDLILINPEEALPISQVLTFYGREVLKVFPDTYCDEILKIFKTGRTHIAIVHEENTGENSSEQPYTILGIVTLEDVIEEIIKDEIADENDIDYSKENVNRPHHIFKLEIPSKLTSTQVATISSYLSRSSTTFRLLPEEYLKRLLHKCEVVELKQHGDDMTFLFEKGKSCDFGILTLHGKMEVMFGDDKFVTEIRPWTLLGERALTRESFVPDFDARAENTTYLKILKKDYIDSISEVFVEDESFFLPKDMEWLSPVLSKLAKNTKIVPKNEEITFAEEVNYGSSKPKGFKYTHLDE